eukprot:6791072-Alexandrium_andersonii.AAC.1
MSASLVGSEMCIRDRKMRFSCWREGHAPTSSAGKRSLRSSECAGRRCSCLLYTSDAADDM